MKKSSQETAKKDVFSQIYVTSPCPVSLPINRSWYDPYQENKKEPDSQDSFEITGVFGFLVRFVF